MAIGALLLALLAHVFLGGYLLTAVAVRRSGRFAAVTSRVLLAGTLLGFVEFLVPAWTGRRRCSRASCSTWGSSPSAPC